MVRRIRLRRLCLVTCEGARWHAALLHQGGVQGAVGRLSAEVARSRRQLEPVQPSQGVRNGEPINRGQLQQGVYEMVPRAALGQDGRGRMDEAQATQGLGGGNAANIDNSDQGI